MKNRASSAMLDAQSTATELGRDRDKRRYVPMDALPAPQPTAREMTLGHRRTAKPQGTRDRKHNYHPNPGFIFEKGCVLH